MLRLKIEGPRKTFSTDVVTAAHAIAWEPLCYLCAKSENFLGFRSTR